MKQKRWRTFLTIGGAVVGGWLGLWLLGPVLLPFAAGGGIAALAEPVVRKLKLPRWASSVLCVGGVYLLLGGAVYLLCRVLCGELTGLFRSLPEMVCSLEEPLRQIKRWLLDGADRCPDGIGAALRQGVEDFFQNGAGLGSRLYDRAFTLASTVLKKLPDLMLFFFTAVLSGFMISVQLPRLKELWHKKAPAVWKDRLQAVGRRLKGTLWEIGRAHV